MEVTRVGNYTPPPPPPPSAPVEVAPVPETEIVYAPATTVALPVGEEAELARAVQRSEVKLERAVAELNQSLASYARHMSISMHQATGRAMVTVYNTDTREIIREIPPEKVLDAHASLMEIAGLFVDTRG